MEQPITPENLNLFCRTCLQELKPRLKKCNIHCMHLRIRQWLQVASNSEDDVHPGFVCGPCRDKLEDFLEFRQMCARAHRTVKAILEKSSSPTKELKFDANALDEMTVVVDEAEAAVYNEIYEADGNLLEFDCMLIPNKSEITISSQYVENDETITTLNDELSDSLDYTVDEQQSLDHADMSINDSKHTEDEEDNAGESENDSSNMQRALSQENLDKQILRPFLCPKCDRGFITWNRLQEHLNEVHGQISITCEYEGCEKVFRRTATYQRHTREKHGYTGKQKPVPVQQDDKEATPIASLEEHQYCRKTETLEGNEQMCVVEDQEEATLVLNESIDDSDLLEFDFIPIARTPTEATSEQVFEIEEPMNDLEQEDSDPAEYLEEDQPNTGNEMAEDNDESNCSVHIKYENDNAEESKKDSDIWSNSSDEPIKKNRMMTRKSTGVPQKIQRWKFPCDHCDKVCLSQRSLDNHKKTHEELKPYQCPKCDSSFVQLSLLRKHLGEIHNKHNFICKYDGCGMEFSRSADYAIHCRYKHKQRGKSRLHEMTQKSQKVCEEIKKLPTKLSHRKERNNSDKLKSLETEKEKPVKEKPSEKLDKTLDKDLMEFDFVPIDEKSTVTPSSQYYENEEHVNDELTEYSDEDCMSNSSIHKKDEYRSAEEIDDSQRSSSANSTADISRNPKTKRKKNANNKFRCSQCHKPCLNQETLDCHERIHQGLRPYPCSKCDRSFRVPNILRTHIIEVHGKINIKCEYAGCGKEFRRSHTYRHHVRYKHAPADKQIVKPKLKKCQQPHVCEVCGKVCPDKYKLKDHQYTHKPKEEYRFHCTQCNKGFLYRYLLKLHELCHTDVKNYECPHCGFKVRTKYELRTHVLKHTKKHQYSCPKCPMVFSAPAYLARHVRVVHEGRRPYACRYCDRKFGVYHGWKNHEMIHTGEKPHECPECGLRFIQLSSMRRHMKNIHKCVGESSH